MRIFILLICSIFSASVVHADCTVDISPTMTNDKFTDGGEEVTVAVNSSSLMWKKCVEGLSGDKCENGSPRLFTWQQALQLPKKVNEAGAAKFKDWRLPTLNELLSLVERQCTDPAINPNHFPNTPSLAVWSQTPYADVPDSAWVVNFYYGLPFFDYRSRQLPVRLVRTATAQQESAPAGW